MLVDAVRDVGAAIAKINVMEPDEGMQKFCVKTSLSRSYAKIVCGVGNF